MSSRTYKVVIVVGATDKVYCVDAASKAAAENHVRAKHITASVASGREVADMIAKGIKVENAGDPDTPPLPGVAQS